MTVAWLLSRRASCATCQINEKHLPGHRLLGCVSAPYGITTGSPSRKGRLNSRLVCGWRCLRADGTKRTTKWRTDVQSPYHQSLRHAEKATSRSRTIRSHFVATAHEVHPKFGPALLIDDHETTWTITRNMAGSGLHSLRASLRD